MDILLVFLNIVFVEKMNTNVTPTQELRELLKNKFSEKYPNIT